MHESRHKTWAVTSLSFLTVAAQSVLSVWGLSGDVPLLDLSNGSSVGLLPVAVNT